MVIQVCANQTVATVGVGTGLSGTPQLGGGSLGSPQLGYPKNLTVAVQNNGVTATTMTVNVAYAMISTNGGASMAPNWVAANIRNTDTAAVFSNLAAGAGAALDVTPAPFVQVVPSVSADMSVWVYTS